MTLSDDIVAAMHGALISDPRGATVAQLSEMLAAQPVHIRAALRILSEGGHLIYFRDSPSRLMRAVMPDHDFGKRRVCENCASAFTPARDHSIRFCNRSCRNAWSWRSPESRRRRIEAIRSQKSTPSAKARQAEINHERWSDPAAREKLSAKNRARWADPASRAKISTSIQAVNGSAENRRKAADAKRKLWADPEYREKATKAIRKAKSSHESRVKMSEALKRRWADPVARGKLIEIAMANIKKATTANTGAHQTAAHVAKRVQSAKRKRS